MQLKGKITELDLKDVQKLLRSKLDWVKFILVNWYGIALGCIILWATVAGILGEAHPNWRGLGVMWLIVAAIMALATLTTKRKMARDFKTLNAKLPDWVNITAQGIKLDGSDGGTAFQPWRSLVRWREGKRVILIDQSEKRGFIILPISELPEVQKESLRQLLRSHFPATMAAAQ